MIMSLEDFIEFAQQQIISAIRGVSEMQAVLVYKASENPDVWNATQWPQQVIGVVGHPTREEAAEEFVNAWNAQYNVTTTAEDFRIFGPIMTSTELSETDDGWYATTYADRKYEVGPHSTLEMCKVAFVDMWNSSYPDAQQNPVADVNVDWVNHP